LDVFQQPLGILGVPRLYRRATEAEWKSRDDSRAPPLPKRQAPYLRLFVIVISLPRHLSPFKVPEDLPRILERSFKIANKALKLNLSFIAAVASRRLLEGNLLL